MPKPSIFFFIVTVFILAAIAWGALTVSPPIPKLFAQQDKFEHFLAFSALTLWLSAMLRPSRWMFAGIFALTCAIGLEGAQALFSTTREASLPDVIASFAGIVAALLFIVLARASLATRAARPA